jgi:hypothetical protein
VDTVVILVIGAAVGLVPSTVTLALTHRFQSSRDDEERRHQSARNAADRLAELQRDDRSHLRGLFENGSVALRDAFRTATPLPPLVPPEVGRAAIARMREAADGLLIHLDDDHPVNVAFASAIAAVIAINSSRSEVPPPGSVLSGVQRRASEDYNAAFNRYAHACRAYLGAV